MKKILFSLLALIAFQANAQNPNEIYLGLPGYGGSGCPSGSVSATLSPDAKTLSMLFDEYYVQVGGTTGKSFERKACNIAVPVHVPQGWSVSVLQVDYRGFNYLPASARSQFYVEYFFAGMRGPVFSRNFYGPLEDEYFINNTLGVQAIVWSRCGADVNLRVNSSINVRTYANREAYSSVDSADVSAAIVYHLQWRRC